MYAFGERIQKRNLSESLRRGIQGHTLFEIFFKNFKETNSWVLAKAAISEFCMSSIDSNTSAENIKFILDLQTRVFGFLDFYESTIRQWEVIAVEEEFRVDIPDPRIDKLTYAFTPDLIIRHNGAVRVIDWKFVYNFYNATAFSLLPQIPKYIGALREMGWANVKDGFYGFVRYRSLKTPTDSQLYRLAQVQPNRVNIKRTWEEYRAVARDIAHLKQHTLVGWEQQVKRVSNHLVCNSCSFKELCAAEKDGGTGERIRQELYIPSTYGYSEVDEV